MSNALDKKIESTLNDMARMRAELQRLNKQFEGKEQKEKHERTTKQTH